MPRRNSQNDLTPQPALPNEEIAGLITSLVQNGSIPIALLQSLTTAGTPPTPTPTKTPPSTNARNFNRPGRGTGGVLDEKKKTSKDITAPASKRKTLVNSDVEPQSPSASGSGTSNGRATKRQKATKVSRLPHNSSATTDELELRFPSSNSKKQLHRNPKTLPLKLNHLRALQSIPPPLLQCAPSHRR